MDVSETCCGDHYDIYKYGIIMLYTGTQQTNLSVQGSPNPLCLLRTSFQLRRKSCLFINLLILHAHDRAEMVNKRLDPFPYVLLAHRRREARSRCPRTEG